MEVLSVLSALEQSEKEREQGLGRGAALDGILGQLLRYEPSPCQ